VEILTRKVNISIIIFASINADVAELADAQDLKSFDVLTLRKS